MYRIGDKGATHASFPANMQNPETWAFGAALDRQMQKLMDFGRCVLVWPELDSLNSKYCDYAAASLRALYYSSEYDRETRIAILKGALSTYRYAGTVKGVEELLDQVFENARLVPWFEYDGEPYHFKIVLPTDSSEEVIRKFSEILEKVKAARSIIDGIETTTYTYSMEAHVASGASGHEKMEELA